jgi:hypothetical protein
VIYHCIPTTSSIRVRFIQACFGLFALTTKRRSLHIAEHVGIFAGSFPHRGIKYHK